MKTSIEMPQKIPGLINLLLHYNFRFIVYTAFFIFPLSFTCLLAQIPTPSIQGSSEALYSSLNSSDPMRGNGMSFTPNKGQFVDMNKQQRPDILYKGEGAGADIYLRKSGISYVLSDANETWHKIHEAMEEKEKTHEMTYEDKKVFTEAMMSKMLMKIHRIDVDFVGGNKNYETINFDQIDGYTNYYLGHCPHGITNVNSYNRIIAKNIYPNIDVVYYGGKEKGLKYDIVVNSGGDPNQIKLKYNGAEDVEIKNEKLIIKNSIGEMVEQLPKVYQNIEGKIVDVKAVYKLEHLSNNDVIVHFSFSIFNPSFPLVVDPWATYYSGGGATFTIGTGSGVAADGAGSVIVTGNTSTGDFPVSPGAFQMTPASQGEAFLVKFNVSGTRVFGTYFGGNAGDQGFGMAADGNNDILISGVTASTNFPTKNPGGGAYFQSAMAGNGDAFVAKFSPAGLLIWSTLYGGSGSDQGIDVIADGANNVILTGSTASTNLPTQVPYQAALSGTQDAFVAKFNSGCVRQWATYYGGTSTESAYGVACDAGGNVHFTGNTASTDFPAIAAFQGVAGGGGDAFIVKLNGANGLPLWSTYYGGTLAEWAYGVAVDTPGNCIIVGNTQSANNIASGGANQIANAGNGDGFVVKFNTAGGRLWGTYHGGVNAEVTGGCAVDNKNNIYWYGEVEDEKPNPSWISVCAYQNTYNGAEDQLISKFDPSGKLLCTTAIGGPGEEDFDGGSVAPHFDIAVWDPYLYISAHVRQGGYPVSPGAFQTINRTPAKGENDIFINQLCMNICQQQFLGTTATANKTIVCPNTPISFSSSVYNACDTTGLRFKWTFTGATPSSSTVSNPVISYSSPGFYSVKLVVSTPCQKDSVLKTNYIIVNPCTINATASTSTICSSTCTNITAAGSSGTAPYTYSWNTGGTSATVNVCPATTTDYTVMVTDASGNYAATTTTVFVHPLLSMTSTSTNATCTTNGNASVTVTSGTAPYTYTWSSGQTSTASGYAPGNYTVTVTDAKGCTLTKSFSLTSSSPVTASFTYSSACVGALVNFTNTGTSGTGATYNWTISPLTPANVSGTTNNFSYTFLTAGSYSVLHQVSSGGCLATVTNIITITNCTAGPTVTATGSSVCPGVCATVTSNGTGGSSPYTYSWSNSATTQNINPCPATTTTYTVTIRDTGGNTSTSTAVVTINPSVSATTTPTNISCNGSNNGSVTATGAGGSPAFSYSWSAPGGSGSTISGLAAGTYTVTVTDSKGCSATSSAAISSPPALSGLFTKGTANCNACGCKEWIMINASGGTNPYTYTWPDGYINRFKNKLCPGPYSINVTDKNGCTINVSLTAP